MHDSRGWTGRTSGFKVAERLHPPVL